MRIISKFHDYYDVGQSHGYDASTLYLRDEIEIDIPKDKLDPFGYVTEFSFSVIGFCGKIYPVAVGQYWRGTMDRIEAYCYSIEEIDKIVEAQDNPIRIASYHGKKISYREKRKDGMYTQRQELAKKFNDIKQITKYKEYFAKYNSPIWLERPRKGKLFINPSLFAWEFYRIFDAYTAFVEVEMFVGGVLTTPAGKEPPKMSDEDIQEIKGFTHEYSFRKEPTSKKRGKK